MTAATVSIAGTSSDDFTRSQHAVWASLPESLTQAPAQARLNVIDGRTAGWLDTLKGAIRPGTAGILVVHPSAEPSAPDIRSAAADAGISIAVQTTWAAHPAVAPFARAAAGRLADIALIDSVVQLAEPSARPWPDVLVEHLSLVRAAVGPLERARFAACHQHGYTVHGPVGTSTVVMSAVQSAAQPRTARLAAYGTTSEAHLIVPADRTAAPAAAWFVDSAGAVTQPTWYEDTSRASWRRLHAAVAGRPGEGLTDLADLADDIGLVTAIAGDWRTCH